MLTNIFQMGWFNHQLVMYLCIVLMPVRFDICFLPSLDFSNLRKQERVYQFNGPGTRWLRQHVMYIYIYLSYNTDRLIVSIIKVYALNV